MRKIHLDSIIKKITKDYDLLPDIKIDKIRFLDIRLISSLVVFILTVIIFKYGYIYAPLLTIVYYYLYYYIFITSKINERTKLLEKEAITFFEIFNLCLASGYNIEQALEVTVNNTKLEITKIFKKVLFEVKFGKSLNEALVDTKKNIASENINNIILNIRESSKYGNDLYNLLEDQINLLKSKRVLTMKENINKIPMKVSVISVLILVPLMLMLILGPIIINYI